MRTQQDIDSPRKIKPAEFYVKGHNREGSFYIRERRNREPFFVMDENLKSAIGAGILAVAFWCVVMLLG